MQRRGLPRHPQWSSTATPGARTGYRPTKIDPSQVTMLDGGLASALWGHPELRLNTRKRFASARAPDRAVVRGRLPQRLPGDRG